MLVLMAFFNVCTTWPWPITVSKLAGRYLRAETTKFSMPAINLIFRHNKIKLLFVDKLVRLRGEEGGS